MALLSSTAFNEEKLQGLLQNVLTVSHKESLKMALTVILFQNNNSNTDSSSNGGKFKKKIFPELVPLPASKDGESLTKKIRNKIDSYLLFLLHARNGLELNNTLQNNVMPESDLKTQLMVEHLFEKI